MFRKRVERRSAASAVRSTRKGGASEVQRLEARRLFAVSMAFEGLFNASKFPGNQSETAIAIDHTNPNHLFASSNFGAFREPDQGPNDPIAESGIFTTFSLDNGLSWTPRVLAADNDNDGVSDDVSATIPAARLIGDIDLTDTAGGSTTDVTVSALATTAAGVSYAINIGPGNRIQIAQLSFPTAPPGATGQVTATTVAQIFAQTVAAGGAALNGTVLTVNAADFNPIDGRLYFVASGLAADGVTPGQDLLFSVDVNPDLTRAAREASVVLVGSFGALTDGQAAVTGLTFDRVDADVRLVGILSDPAAGVTDHQLFNAPLTDVTIVNPVAVTAASGINSISGVVGGIQIHRDTTDGLNDVIALTSDNPSTPAADPLALRIGTDGRAVELGPLASGSTGAAPVGLTFNPTLVDPFTQRVGAYVAADSGTDELFYVDVRDRVFPVACCDPSAAYDDFGNLFYIYLAIDPLTSRSAVAVLLSVDDGQTFEQIAEFRGEQPTEPVSVDRCEVTTARLADGTSAVWVSFVDFSSTAYSITAVGATITGLGVVGTTDRGLGGAFLAPQKLPQGGPGTGAPLPHNIAHVNIATSGIVSVAHQEVGRNPRDRIFVNTDPDGLGPAGFGNAVLVDVTQLTFFEPQPGQPERGVSAVPTLAYDRSNGPNQGRLYIAYAQAVTEQRADIYGLPISAITDSNILLRFSDDHGGTWSPPIRVNDDPVTDLNSQFFQRVSVDPVTGNVAVGWLDSRDDVGGGDADDEIGYYLAVGQSQSTGVAFAPNMKLNVGLSNARFSGNFGNDYGDYTALDFYNNVVWASYPDNSNSTGDNPSGKLRAFDIYAARVRVTDTPEVVPPFVTPASPLSPTLVKPVSLVRKGRFYQLRVRYSHPSGVNAATVDGGDVVVTGPNGFSQPMQLVRAKAQQQGTRVLAMYRLPAPGGKFDSAENGVYTATLQAGAVTSTDNTTTTAGGTLTRFVVNVKAPRVRGAARELPPPSAALLPLSGPFSDVSLLADIDQGESLRLLASQHGLLIT